VLDDNVPKPWQGQTTLVFALAAAAMGLGNVLRLPYLIGEHGGAPFFLTYALTVFLVAAPLLAAEVMLGSHGRGSPIGALRWASDQAGRSHLWSLLGAVQACLAMVLLALLVLLASWMLELALVINRLELSAASAIEVSDYVGGMIQTGQGTLRWALLAGAVLAAALGPQYAMAVIGWLVLPTIAVGLLSLVQYAVDFGDLAATGRFLFASDYAGFTQRGIFAGILSGLLTAGAGLGIGSCFGAHAPRNLPLLRSVIAALVLDTAGVILIAVALIPLLTSSNVVPNQGLGFLFIGVSYAFANLPLGEIYGAIFFGVAALACFATIVALMEPAIMVLRRELGLSRTIAALLTGGATCLLVWLLPLFQSMTEWGGRVVDVSVMAVMLLLALFVGWRLPRPVVRGELYREPAWLFLFWWYLLRFVVPLILLVALCLSVFAAPTSGPDTAILR